MSKRIEVILLCEDRQQEVFVRHWLVKSGVNWRKIRIQPYPEGKGSGEQHVRKVYSNEVRANRQGHHNRGLAVVTDADTLSTGERLAQLDQALTAMSMPKRGPGEPIAIFIPKRNIETWIWYLQGQAVDEVTVYPKLQNEGDCKSTVDKLPEQCRAGLPIASPPSLRLACDEMRRLVKDQ